MGDLCRSKNGKLLIGQYNSYIKYSCILYVWDSRTKNQGDALRLGYLIHTFSEITSEILKTGIFPQIRQLNKDPQFTGSMCSLITELYRIWRKYSFQL